MGKFFLSEQDTASNEAHSSRREFAESESKLARHILWSDVEKTSKVMEKCNHSMLKLL